MGFFSFLKYTFIIFAAHLATSCVDTDRVVKCPNKREEVSQSLGRPTSSLVPIQTEERQISCTF
jgi:hypothetical protein